MIVEVARKKRRSHPYPLEEATHRIKKYERHVENLIFLLRPERDHLFKQTGKCYLYENLLGGIDQIDHNGEDDEEDDDTMDTNLRNQRDLRDLLEQTKSLRDHPDANTDDDTIDNDDDSDDNGET